MKNQASRVERLEQRARAVKEQVAQLEARIGDLSAERAALQAKIQELRRLHDSTEGYRSGFRDCVHELERSMRDRVEKAKNELHLIANEKSNGFPWLENAIARYLSIFEFATAYELANKKQPAKKSADSIRALASEKRALQIAMASYRNRVEYYESLFPWLPEYVTDENIDDVIEAQMSSEEYSDQNDDSVRRWLTQAEFEKFSDDDKCQIALDRYVQSGSKSAWHAGREYERYIGYRYEQDGYDVTYEGAIKRKADYGRDLLAKKNNQHLVIQCKRWREERTIREKHIQQLFGTTVEYMINELGAAPPWSFDSAAPSQRAQSGMLFGNTRDVEVEPVLEVTTKLSDDALRFADALGITVKITEFDRDYPRIKCNISPDGSKIFHLPMDQMYDRVKIEPHKGEFFAKTVAEATDRGFRRAYRWRGSGDSSGST